jgi:hypothetical protein
VVGSWYSMTGYGIALKKGSIYKEMIDRKIIEYIYSGQMERSQKYWFTGSCTNQQEEKKTDGLSLIQISSVFLLLLSGVIIGVLLLIIENCWIRYVIKTNNKKYYDNNKFKKDRKLERSTRKLVKLKD